MQLRFVPAGKFVMGSPASEKERFDNELLHPVCLSSGFWLGATPVTVAEFSVFARESGYKTSAEQQGWSNGAWNERLKAWDRVEGGSWKHPGFEQGPHHPVVCISWYDAVAFCRWLSVKEGRQYRLPTESEWEYACRAGHQTAYPWGDTPEAGEGWANGADRTARDTFKLFPPFPWADGYLYTSPVGSFKPNGWGFYDMIGNALQWCEDWFGDYPSGPVADPHGPPRGKNRILRGGSFVYGPRHCRCAFRGRNLPEFENFYTGFRVVAD